MILNYIIITLFYWHYFFSLNNSFLIKQSRSRHIATLVDHFNLMHISFSRRKLDLRLENCVWHSIRNYRHCLYCEQCRHFNCIYISSISVCCIVCVHLYTHERLGGCVRSFIQVIYSFAVYVCAFKNAQQCVFLSFNLKKKIYERKSVYDIFSRERHECTHLLQVHIGSMLQIMTILCCLFKCLLSKKSCDIRLKIPDEGPKFVAKLFRIRMVWSDNAYFSFHLLLQQQQHTALMHFIALSSCFYLINRPQMHYML